MKRNNRLITLILCGALLLSCLAGCANKNNVKSTEDTEMSTESTQESTGGITDPTNPEKQGYLSQSNTTIEPVRTLEEIKNSLTADDQLCDQFDLEKYLLPYWEGNIVYNESITFYRDSSGREYSIVFLEET